ncbi:MAG: hypothetical protein IKX28_07815 [Bacteroidales bacterium]|nr:hypothetical protein [Bacteroidales bacterium]
MKYGKDTLFSYLILATLAGGGCAGEVFNLKGYTMRRIDLRQEDNYNEFLRLLQDDDYLDVTFDKESGGVSAVHKRHKFSKQMGAYGVRQGDYERIVVAILRKCGHLIVLEAETNVPGVKSFDGFLDDIPMEIKAIEGRGIWAISSKLRQAEKQHAQCVILYFPEEELYSPIRIMEGVRLYRSGLRRNLLPGLSRLLVVVRDRLVAEWNQKATPIEGWSI